MTEKKLTREIIKKIAEEYFRSIENEYPNKRHLELTKSLAEAFTYESQMYEAVLRDDFATAALCRDKVLGLEQKFFK